MSSVKWETILNDVMPHLPGCETNIALHNIKRAAIEFCEKSKYFRAETDLVDVAAGEREIDIDSPVTGTVVVKVLDTFFDGKELTTKSVSALNVEMPDWRTSTGEPSAFTQLSPSALLLAPVPDAPTTSGLQMTVALAPTYESSGIERYIPQHFIEGIAAGALARMLVMQNKPWTDPALAAVFANRFNNEIAAASAIAEQGFGMAVLRTKPCP